MTTIAGTREFVTFEELLALGGEEIRGDEIRKGDCYWSESYPYLHRIADTGQEQTPGWVGITFEDKSGTILRASDRYWVLREGRHRVDIALLPFVTDTVDVTFEDG